MKKGIELPFAAAGNHKTNLSATEDIYRQDLTTATSQLMNSLAPRIVKIRIN